MAVIRQIVLVAALVVAALWAWLRFVPSAEPFLERAGVMEILRSHDPAIFGIRLLPPEATEAAAAGGPPGAGPGGGRPGGGGPGGGFGARGPAAVIAATVETGVMNDIVTAIGDGQALRSVTVTPEASGRIVALPVRAGQYVEAGALIAALDKSAEEIALERARLVRADAEERVARQQRLYDSGTTSDVQLRDAELALRTAELAVRQAEIDLEQRRILAPIGGWIGLLTAEVGDQVAPATTITRIDDRSRILVEFRLPERFVGRLEEGDAVLAEPLAQPGVRISGHVRALDNRVDPTSRSLRVQAELDNAGDGLRAGMAFSIRIDFAGETYPQIPALAVQWGADGAFVWAVREGRAARVPVRIMQRNAQTVLVRAELEPGETVITEGVQTLRPGAEVAPRGADDAPRGGPDVARGAPGGPAAGDGPGGAAGDPRGRAGPTGWVFLYGSISC